jgi:hypothetical protein
MRMLDRYSKQELVSVELALACAVAASITLQYLVVDLMQIQQTMQISSENYHEEHTSDFFSFSIELSCD